MPCIKILCIEPATIIQNLPEVIHATTDKIFISCSGMCDQKVETMKSVSSMRTTLYNMLYILPSYYHKKLVKIICHYSIIH